MLNKETGNMYKFVTHTWNPIKGVCHHGCKYCYMHPTWDKYRMGKPTLRQEEFTTNLNEGERIFVGSSTDIFAENIKDKWIKRVLDYCAVYNEDKPQGRHIIYFFQSKNPQRILQFIDHPVFKHAVVLTTLESNRNYPDIMCNAPRIEDRVKAMEQIAQKEIATMVTVEPIMDFDTDELVQFIRRCKPRWVNIGRNSKDFIQLPEPTIEKTKELIKRLEACKEIGKVNIKDNAQKWFNKA